MTLTALRRSVSMASNADYSQIPVGLRPKPPEPDPDDHVWGEADGKSFH